MCGAQALNPQEFFLGKEHMTNLTKDDYHRFREQDYYGWFLLGKPVLGLANLELIKHVLVKDFNHFVDRTNPEITQLFNGGGDLDKVLAVDRNIFVNFRPFSCFISMGELHRWALLTRN
jgi:hypothetical protein